MNYLLSGIGKAAKKENKSQVERRRDAKAKQGSLPKGYLAISHNRITMVLQANTLAAKGLLLISPGLHLVHIVSTGTRMDIWMDITNSSPPPVPELMFHSSNNQFSGLNVA